MLYQMQTQEAIK